MARPQKTYSEEEKNAIKKAYKKGAIAHRFAKQLQVSA